MVSNRNSEGVLDPKLPDKPSSRALKRTLLVALRCVDPNAQKRPKMGHVVHMLEADDFPFRDVSSDHQIFLLRYTTCIGLIISHHLIVPKNTGSKKREGTWEIDGETSE